MQMPTRSLARPVVLLLSYGFMHAWMQHHPSFAAPAPEAASTAFGLPTAFVPQRIVAKKRVVALTAAAAASVLWRPLLSAAAVMVMRGSERPLRVLMMKGDMGWPRVSGHDVHCFNMMKALSEQGHVVGLAHREDAGARSDTGCSAVVHGALRPRRGADERRAA